MASKKMNEEIHYLFEEDQDNIDNETMMKLLTLLTTIMIIIMMIGQSPGDSNLFEKSDE
jgi:hypothetical protein